MLNVGLSLPKCACVNLEASMCVLSCNTAFDILGMAFSKAQGSCWNEPEKKGIDLYFYIILPKGITV